MAPILRFLLIAGALLTMVFFIRQIRKKRLQIDYAIFWILFSILLLAIALFPQIITWTAGVLGFVSPANLVFLVVIFLLILRLFSMTMKISKLDQQVAGLTHKLSIMDLMTDREKTQSVELPTLTDKSETIY